jgi:hypothetical protein
VRDPIHLGRQPGERQSQRIPHLLTFEKIPFGEEERLPLLRLELPRGSDKLVRLLRPGLPRPAQVLHLKLQPRHAALDRLTLPPQAGILFRQGLHALCRDWVRNGYRYRRALPRLSELLLQGRDVEGQNPGLLLMPPPPIIQRGLEVIVQRHQNRHLRAHIRPRGDAPSATPPRLREPPPEPPGRRTRLELLHLLLRIRLHRPPRVVLG